MQKLTNEQKKKMILASARKLFYEQGYNETFISHIATDCGISKQLLIYYYPTKPHLANSVIDQISRETKALAEKKLFDYFGGMQDLQVCTAVEIKLFSLILLRDTNAMRFNRETLFLTCDPTYAMRDTSYFDAHVKKYDLNLDREKDELKMVSDIFDISSGMLLSNYSLGQYHCTETEFLDYIIEMVYHLMKVPEQRIKEINRLSNTVLELLDFKFKPYFIVE